MGSKSSPAPGKPPPWGELPAIFRESAKMSKNEQNGPKLEKVNKSQLSGNKKSTKVNSRENIPNIEMNLPQVAKMRKEAPKPKFNHFKVPETECFCENNLHGALENARETQIWRGKCCRRQERRRSRLHYIGSKSWIEGASKRG